MLDFQYPCNPRGVSGTTHRLKQKEMKDRRLRLSLWKELIMTLWNGQNLWSITEMCSWERKSYKAQFGLYAYKPFGNEWQNWCWSKKRRCLSLTLVLAPRATRFCHVGEHTFLSVVSVSANPEYKSDYLVKVNFRSNLLGFHIVELPGCVLGLSLCNQIIIWSSIHHNWFAL